MLYLKNLKLVINQKVIKNFTKFLKKIGFNFNAQKKKNFKYTVKAFQRHFRPQIINGKIDMECLEIAKNLSIRESTENRLQESQQIHYRKYLFLNEDANK